MQAPTKRSCNRFFKLRSEQANGIVQDNDEVYSIDLVAGKPLRLWKLIREKNLSDF